MIETIFTTYLVVGLGTILLLFIMDKFSEDVTRYLAENEVVIVFITAGIVWPFFWASVIYSAIYDRD